MLAVRADAVFTAEKFTAEELVRIMAAGAGKRVYFPSGVPRAEKADWDEVLAEFARGKKVRLVAEQFGVSEQAVYVRLRRERAGYAARRLLWWNEQGPQHLSWAQIGRLFKRARETCFEKATGQTELTAESAEDAESAERG